MLADVFSIVGTALTAAYPTLEIQVGNEFLKEQSSPPRVVWVPMSDTYEGAEQHGATEPRAILTRVAGVDVHIWGLTIAATEGLIQTVLATIHGTAGLWGAYGVNGGSWGSGADGGDLGNFGYEYTLNLVFRIPVVMPAYGTALITSAPLTKQITFGDGTTEPF